MCKRREPWIDAEIHANRPYEARPPKCGICGEYIDDLFALKVDENPDIWVHCTCVKEYFMPCKCWAVNDWFDDLLSDNLQKVELIDEVN